MVNINEAEFDKIMDSIVKKIKDRVLKDILSEIVEALKKLTTSLFELAEAQKRTEERLNELTKKVDELAEAQKRTEERLNELAEAQKRTEERLNELAEAQKRTEETLASLIGEVARMRGDLIETKVVTDLSSFLSKRGFDVFHHFPDIPYIDAVVETDGFFAVIEICKKCDLRDIEQVIRGAKILEEKEGIKPDVLVVFSYTGDMEKSVLEAASKKGVIVEWSTRRLVKKLLELSKKK